MARLRCPTFLTRGTVSATRLQQREQPCPGALLCGAGVAGRSPRFLSLMCAAGECSADELERMMGIVANPRAYKIPDWFLNRQKDHKTGRFSQASGTRLTQSLVMYLSLGGEA